MNRINPIDEKELPGEGSVGVRAANDHFERKSNLLRTIAHSPVALRAYLGFSLISQDGLLDEPTRARIALAVSEQNGSEYCISEAIKAGKRSGLTAHEVVRARAGASEESRADLAVQFATLLLETSGVVSDQEVKKLRQAGFGDGELIEIIAHVALNFFSNIIANVSMIESDQTETGVYVKCWGASVKVKRFDSVVNKPGNASSDIIGM